MSRADNSKSEEARAVINARDTSPGLDPQLPNIVQIFQNVWEMWCTQAMPPKSFLRRENHYENTPIQIYRKFHLKKLKIFR